MLTRLSGVVREWSVTASDTSTTVVLSGYRGQAIQVLNDGSETVYITTLNVAVNNPSNGDKFFSVGAGEATFLEFGFGRFSYICGAGLTSALRIRVLSEN